jgi:DNA helicase-2/ATP-dependent DNA helicase PcrA
MNVTPSPEQLRAIDLGVDSIRIRAGAGTGKTTTIAMVVAGLVRDHGVEPERVLGITFTNKAASELADRIRSSLTGEIDEGRQVEVHTYHGFAAQVLSEFAPLAGLDRQVRVITPTFSRQLLGERLYRTEYQRIDITSPASVDKVRRLADRLGDHLLQPGDVSPPDADADETQLLRAEMLATLADYSDDKHRLGVVDYSDLVTLSTRLMQANPGLAREVRERYQVVVLDEYQDTNPAQRVLLSTLFGDGFPVIGVGDEDQTIYEWRGASAENFELFAQHFARPGGSPAHDLGLTTNRRSAPEILEVANRIRRMANPEADDLVPDGRITAGHVATYWGADAVDEAAWIATRLEQLHEAGTPWREMAVLFRKNKDFAVVVDAMRRADIPVEVANLGGLLSVPEVSDLQAWLTILDRPGDSAGAVQILTGSRYRLGLADLAPIAYWRRSAAEADDNDEVSGVSLLEAVEHIDEIELRPEATEAIRHFHTTYRDLLVESQGTTLVEVCRLVLDRTRAWQDMDSLPATQRLTARLNIYRILDLAEDWSPLGGKPSLGAFLDYLDAMEDEPAEELDSAHLSGEDAVALVTVHRAKGLEWDVVAVPAVVARNFPAQSMQFPDPARFPEHLPPEYRIDHLLDEMPDDPAARKDFFRERNALQEWRIAYVAATRARRNLIVSGAYWYGTPEPGKKPHVSSELFDLVAEMASENIKPLDDAPPRPEILRVEDEQEAPDPIFPEGWANALRDTRVGGTSLAGLAQGLGLSEAVSAEVGEITDRLFRLDDLDLPETADDQRVISVTGLVTYAQCPRRFFWTDIDPLPRRRNQAAVAGTELHRRIELHLRGNVPFEELADDLYDAPEDGPGPGEGGFAAFADSRFAANEPLMIEAPFELSLAGGTRMRGRVDAVYASGEHWEVVDFKSGRPKSDPSRVVQLEAYAVACRDGDFGHPRPTSIDVTFAYFGGGLTEETYAASDDWISKAAAHIDGLTKGIGEGEFRPTPGLWCGSCDFLRFCDAGQAEVGHSR